MKHYGLHPPDALEDLSVGSTILRVLLWMVRPGAPLLAVVREELSLAPEQIGNTIIASVTITVLARVILGWLCDRIGPRLAKADYHQASSRRKTPGFCLA